MPHPLSAPQPASTAPAAAPFPPRLEALAVEVSAAAPMALGEVSRLGRLATMGQGGRLSRRVFGRWLGRAPAEEWPHELRRRIGPVASLTQLDRWAWVFSGHLGRWPRCPLVLATVDDQGHAVLMANADVSPERLVIPALRALIQVLALGHDAVAVWPEVVDAHDAVARSMAREWMMPAARAPRVAAELLRSPHPWRLARLCAEERVTPTFLLGRLEELGLDPSGLASGLWDYEFEYLHLGESTVPLGALRLIDRLHSGEISRQEAESALGDPDLLSFRLRAKPFYHSPSGRAERQMAGVL